MVSISYHQLMVSDEFRSFEAGRATRASAKQPATLDELRKGMDAIMGALPLATGVVAEDLEASGVPVIACTRVGGPNDPTLLYFHGGGYRLGSALSYRAFGSHLSRECSSRVVLVDYRLAPEHRFPAAVDDAVAAYRWVLGEMSGSERVVVGGDSAGGGLAAALLLAARGQGLPLPAGGVCLSPWVDLTNSAISFLTRAATDSLFSKNSADDAARLYLDGADPTHPLASPLHGDWRGMPPLLIQVSEDEVLVDDATNLAEVATRAGVDVETRTYPGMPHVWQIHYPAFPETVEAVEQIATFVERVTAA